MKAESLGVDEIEAAVVTVDLHRGHLDPEHATLPLPEMVAKGVVESNVQFLAQARRKGLRIVHVVTSYRRVDEIASNPFWRAIAETEATRGNILNHNLEGSPGLELMPGVYVQGDWVVGTKKRYDCFLHTDLEFVLRNAGINTLLITGVNTNSCVLTTTITASTRDFACVVVKDCVATVDGEDLHKAALACIDRAFGWVMESDIALKAVLGE